MNITTSSYLSRCDLLNKFKTPNLYLIPQVKTISINLSFKSLVKALESHSSYTEKEDIIKKRVYIILYYTLNLLPYINIKSVSNSTDELTLSLLITKKHLIYQFLFSLLIENRVNKKDTKVKSLFLKKKIIKSIFNLNATNFYDLFYIFDFFYKDINIKNILLNFNLYINSINNQKFNIYNLLFFWNFL